MLRNHPMPLDEGDGRFFSPLPHPIPVPPEDLPVLNKPNMHDGRPPVMAPPPLHESFHPPQFLSKVDGPLPQPFENRVDPMDAGMKRGPPPQRGEKPDASSSSSSEGSSEENGASIITIISSSGTGEAGSSQYIYNTPDGAVTDPDLLQAELMFFNTPAKEHFAGEVYEAFNAVQEQCGYDYVRLCQQPASGISEISFNDPFFFPPMMASFFSPAFLAGAPIPRRRLGALKAGDETLAAIAPTTALSNKVVGYFREFYQGKRNLATITSSVVPTTAEVKTDNKEKEFKVRPRIPSVKTRTMKPHPELAKENAHKKIDRKLKQHGHDDHHDHDRDHDKDHKRDQPPKDGKDPRGPPPSKGAPRNEDDGDDRYHHGHDDHHHRGHHDDHHGREDHYFSGALGFGAEGDMCMYQNADQLSDPCVKAISNVYELRDEYWHESNGPHHCHGIFFILLALFGLIYGIRRFKTRHQRKAAHNLLVGLNNDPELKKAVEAKLGITVPPAPVCPFHANNSNGTSPAYSCFTKFLYTIFVLIMAFVASFFITITSLIVTGIIVRGTGMEVVNNETGEVEKQPNGFVVILILFTLSFIQVRILAKLVRRFKAWYRVNYGDSTPSAPPAPVENGNAPSGPTDGGSSSPRRIASTVTNWIAPRVAAVRNAFRRDTDGYAPLSSGDDSTEMIAIGSAYVPVQSSATNPNAAPRVAVFTGVPVTHNGSTAVVTATPVTHVTFV